MEVVDWALRECARMVGDGDILIAVEWELMSRCKRRLCLEFAEFFPM